MSTACIRLGQTGFGLISCILAAACSGGGANPTSPDAGASRCGGGTWRATASTPSADLGIDQNMATDWTTGAAQKAGDWYQVEMGGARLAGYRIVSSRHPEQQATVASAYVDGKQVVKSDAHDWDADAIDSTFAGPITVNTLKLVLVADGGAPWSITELEAICEEP